MADKLTNSLTTSDGLKLHFVCWVPKGSITAGSQPKAIILIVHGMAEHSDRFEDVAELFCDQNMAVASFDQRGHGLSEGPRGHSPSYELLQESILLAFQQIRKRYPDLPVFLYGHSMGGNLVLNYVLDASDITSSSLPNGIIVSAPWLRLAFQPPALQIALAKIAGKFIPTFTQSTKLDPTAISSDLEEINRYQEDPLIHDKITAAMFFSVHERGERALQNASQINIPTLLFHGTADRLTSCKASEEFAKRANSQPSESPKNAESSKTIPSVPIVQFHAIEGGFHELHHEAEPIRNQWKHIVTGWINEQIKA